MTKPRPLHAGVFLFGAWAYNNVMRYFLFLLLFFTSAAHAADITVRDAFVRATPAKISAGYMIIENGGDTDDALTGVTANWAARTELHTIETNRDGVMSMKQVPDIAVTARGTTRLAPGGYHVMFYGVNKPLVENATESVTLHFRHAGDVTAPVTVRPITFKGP